MKKYLTLLLCMAACQLGAQVNWEHTYLENTYSDYIGRLVQKPNGQYIAHFASKEASSTPEYQYLMLLSEDGEILELDTSVQAYGGYPQPHLFPLANGKTQIIGFWETPDSNAMTRAYLTPGFSHIWQGAVKVPKPGVPVMINDTTFIIAGEFGCGIQVAKLGLSGYVHWQNELIDPFYTNCTYDVYHSLAIVKSPDGGVFVTTAIVRPGNNPKLLVAKFSADGVKEWDKTFFNSSNTKVYATLLDDGLYIADGTSIRRLNTQGDLVWEKNLYSLMGSNYYLVTSLVPDPVDGTLMALCYSYASTYSDFQLLKIKPDGTLFWNRPYGFDNLKEESGGLVKTLDNGYIMVGKRFLNNGTFPSDAFLIKTDSVGGVGYSIIEGRVFKDQDGDCAYDPGEQGVLNKPVRVKYGPGEFYAMTDSLGDYRILLNEGQATIELGSFDPYLSFCTESQTINVGNLDTITYNAGGDFIECPLMNVDIGTVGLRPCSTTVYNIWYSNSGNLAADDVKIRLYLGDTLSFVSASVPYTEPEPEVYDFLIGTVAPGQGGSFQVTVMVSCEAMLGDEICTTALITPDTICLWDPSFNNDPPSVERLCNTVVNSFDPNDKRALAGTPEFIGLDSILKFQIRFQNTGNDLAYDITIRDTLSQWLEPLSIEPGAASHPYTWEVRHPGEVRFIFKEILLPDSSSNEPASHGFIQYKVRQRPNLARKTLILNRAGIYFDFNPPIMTNQTAQSVDYPDHPASTYLDLCTGETFNGLPILADTAVVTTYFYPSFDSVVTTHIHLLPVFASTMDTTVAIGTSLDGTGIYADQTVTLHLTAINGCDSTVTANANVLPGVFAPNLLQGMQQVCEKTVFDYALPPNAAASFWWSVTGGVLLAGQGTHGASILWDDLDTGLISVAVLLNGDTLLLPPTLVEIFPNDISLAISGTDTLCAGSASGAIDLTASGSGAPYAFAWDMGSTEEDLSGLTAGNYPVTVTNSFGCRQNSAWEIVGLPALHLQSIVENVSCFGNSDGLISLIASGGVPPYAYSWSNGASGATLADLPAGSYQATLTDGAGCTTNTGFTLTEPNELTIAFDLVQPGPGLSNGLIEATPAGGLPPYYFTWSNGAQGGIVGNLPAGTYQVTLTDGIGCSFVSSATLDFTSATLQTLPFARLSIFPNPVSDRLHLAFDLPTAMPIGLAVFNSLGQKIAVLADQQTWAKGPHRLDWPTGNWAAGMYYLEFTTAGGKLSRRFIK